MDFGWIALSILVLLFIIGWIIAILRGIARFIAFIMCIEKKNCKQDDCCFRGYCNRTALSDKEREAFRKKIESMDDAKEERKKFVNVMFSEVITTGKRKYYVN